MAQGVGTRLAHGAFAGASVALGGVCLIAMRYMPSDTLKIAMIIAGITVPAVIYILGHAIVSEITPVSQRGAMLAINNAMWTSADCFARPFGHRLASWQPGKRDQLSR